MITHDEDEARQAIPRWLSVAQSAEIGELGAVGSKNRKMIDLVDAEARPFLEGQITQLKRRFASEGDFADAQELISLASILDLQDDSVVRDAMALVFSSESFAENDKHIAEHIFQSVRGEIKKIPAGKLEIWSQIASKKRSIRLNPQDSLALTELALLYANIGQNRASENSLKRALILNSNGRYVLRAATRFYAHTGKLEYALWLLRRAAAVKVDPWLKAAVLAVETAMGQSSTSWKSAKSTLSDNSFSPRDLSELAVQVGTVELEGGSRRRAMKFFQQSAISPTENTIAQLEWIGRQRSAFNNIEFNVDINLSDEALAHSAFEKVDWAQVTKSCRRWQQLEPFSARPAIFCSFAASVSMHHLDTATEIAERGLVANSKNATLLNNISVLHALNGKIDRARDFFSRLESLRQNPEAEKDDDIVFMATRGLLSFRSGSPYDGIKHYSQAIEASKERRNPILLLRAYCFMAREICLIDPQQIQVCREEIAKAVNTIERRGIDIPTDINYMKYQFEALSPAKSTNSLELQSSMPSLVFD
jgi:tetratricopeptide (TPR) repeat protein